jgi:hypothetical protein
MKGLFEVVGGSVQGKEHLRVGRNNQDAWLTVETDDYLLVLLADGCGSSQNSEVGAQLGVLLAARIMAAELEKFGRVNYPRVNRGLVNELGWMTKRLGGDPLTTIRNYLLFTLVGAVITPEAAEFFSFGDGVIGVNGHVIEVEPQGSVHNAPAYPAYQLLEPEALQIIPGELRFQVHFDLPTSQLESFVVGTDGVSELKAAQDLTLPGKPQLVGPFSQFWEDDRWFSNPDNLQRYLNMVSRESVKVDREQGSLVRDPGRLTDDTTLIVGRQRKEVEPCLASTLTDEASSLSRPSLLERVARRMSIGSAIKP